MGTVYNKNANRPDLPPLYWINYTVGTKRVREPGCGRNKQASERLLAKREREAEAGTWKPAGFRGDEYTVAGFAERWTAIRESEGIVTAQDDYSRLRDHVLPVLGDRRLAALTRDEVKALVNALRIDGKLAPRSIHHVYGALRAMYARAIETSIVVATPCTLKVRKGELPAKRDKDPTWRHTAVYSLDEVERLITDERLPWNRRVFYALIFLTGARFGETAGRRWRDWDAAAQPLSRLTIATQYDGRELKSPRGDAPVRHVPVHPALHAVLDDWRARGFLLTYGRPPLPSDWIVPSLQGMGLRTVRNGLKRLVQDCEATGIRADRTQHDARRTLFTLLRELGTDREVVAAITHGVVVSDTLRHYEVWRWPVLCEAIESIPLRVTVPSRSGLGAANPPVLQGDPLAGRTGLEPVHPSETRGNIGAHPIAAGEIGAENATRSPSRTHTVTPIVTRGGGMPGKLRAAADVLRSGRVDHLTAEWRGELADACDEAALASAGVGAESEVG